MKKCIGYFETNSLYCFSILGTIAAIVSFFIYPHLNGGAFSFISAMWILYVFPIVFLVFIIKSIVWLNDKDLLFKIIKLSIIIWIGVYFSLNILKAIL